MRHVIGWICFWVPAFWLWFLLVGEWNRIELIAAVVAATITATLGELARTRAGVRARVPLAWLARAKTVPLLVFVDFGILVWALVRSALERKIVRGTFVKHTFKAGDDDAESVGIRAWTAVAATYSPNAYVIDIDKERDVVLLHDLIPWRPSEEPA